MAAFFNGLVIEEMNDHHPKTMVRRRIFLVSIVLILLSACEGPDPIRIGFMAGTTGRGAELGIAARDAVQLAVEQCNEHGGIRGRPVTLLIRDDQQRVETAVQVVQELIEADVDAIIGPMTSNIARAIIPYLNASRIVAVSPTVSTQRLSGKDDYFFRVNPTTDESASYSADHQLKSEGARKFVAIYDSGNHSYSENWLKNFQERFVAGGGQLLATIPFKKDEHQSFSTIVQAALVNDPNGILIIANAMDSALICHQIRKNDQGIIITMAGWGATERLTELGGKAVEGVTTVRFFSRDCPNPAYQTFRKIYLERYQKEPGFPGVNAYEAAQVVLTALDAQKDKQGLKASILSIKAFDGLQGQILFDAYGDVKRSNTAISIVHNQEFVDME